MSSLVILVSAVLVLSFGQTEAHDRYTHATTVVVNNDPPPVVHTHVPLSLSNIIWYWRNGGDALRLGR